MLLWASVHAQLQCKLKLLDFTPRMVPLKLSLKSDARGHEEFIREPSQAPSASSNLSVFSEVWHSPWLGTLYLAKCDGTTAYESLRVREYHGASVEVGEAAFSLKPVSNIKKLDAKGGLDLGLSDEHLIGLNLGIRRCRSVWRQAGVRRWNIKMLEAITAAPWQPQEHNVY